jgi:PKD repeat protein
VWDFGDGQTSTEADPVHQYTGAGAFVARLDIAGANGCENYTSIRLEIFTEPVADFIMPPDPICTNSEILFSNSIGDEYKGYLTYQWYVGEDLASEERDLKYTFTETGTADIKLVVAIPGCADEKIESIGEVKKGPTLEFSLDTSCENEPIQFTSNISEAVTSYAWTFGDGEISTEENPEHTFTNPGMFPVSLAALSESGCNSTVSKDLMIYAKPVTDFEINTDPPFCTGKNIAFSDNTTSADSEVTLLEWDFGDAMSSTDQFPTHVFTEPNNYEVILTATTNAGCSQKAVKTLDIDASPEIEFSITSLCVGMPVAFNGSSVDDVLSWEWNIGDKMYAIHNPSHTFRTSGIYDVEVKAFSDNGCEASITQQIKLPEKLNPDFLIAKNCVEETAIFTDVTSGEDAVLQWEWLLSGEESPFYGNPMEFVFSETGEQTITLNITTEAGCSYTKTSTFNVVPFPKASFTVSSEIGSPPFPVDFTNRSTDATQYLWTFGDASTSDEESPAHTFTETGEYHVSLLASNDEGCEDSFSKLISMSPANPDVNILAITTSENPDRSLKVVITLQNDGNTILKDLPVDIDVSGNIDLREIIKGPVMPQSRFNLTLSYGLKLTNDVNFICAEAILENDQSLQTNRNCVEFTKELIFRPGYPNPVREALTVEWIALTDETITVSLFNSLGTKMWVYDFTSEKGLNQRAIDVESLQKGIYMLVFEAQGIKTTQRLLLTR